MDLRIEALSKRYGDALVLDGVDLTIGSGELVKLSVLSSAIAMAVAGAGIAHVALR